MSEPRHVILDADQIARALDQMAVQIAERYRQAGALALVGIRRGGIPIALRLRDLLGRLNVKDIAMGSVDITLYRDDASTAGPNPRIGPSEIKFPVHDRTVILVDDVLFTGRTTRAAIDALLDYGRPRAVQLAVLVDRGCREFPIQPDYVGHILTTSNEERVDVLFERANGQPDEAVLSRESRA
jgi:pyrimidine operon attenuation protein / uracil phosphoribosyltransferase